MRESEVGSRKSCAPYIASPQEGRNKGFTLVEMSIVLIVVGLVILIVYPAMNAVRSGTQRQATDSHLQALLRATAVYAQANGCLPCPTPATTSGGGFGRVRGDTGTAVCAACTIPVGIAPFVSLGVPEFMAKDGWGRWITMRVDPALTVNFGVVPPTSPCTAADVTSGICTAVGLSQKGLCRTGLPAINRITVQTLNGSTQQAGVIFVSHGANGYGAFFAAALGGLLNGTRLSFPAGTPACASSGHEQCNATTSTLTFYNDPAVVGGNNPFDDSLLYMDRNNLVSFFGNGSCQTTW